MKNENNKTSHTPGPWIVKQDRMHRAPDGSYPMDEIKVPQGLYTVYHQRTAGSGVYWATAGLIESEEDARLIAAAPELLNALEALIARAQDAATGMVQGADKDGLDNIDALAKARAAVNKAKGE